MKFNKEDIVVLDDEGLKRYQDELLKIGVDVAKAFDENGISYSLSGGSILGAIRHQGFIPWDDDIDLNITRSSYNKLLKIFDRILGDKYYIQTPQSHPELGLMVTQIRKKNTVARRKYDWNLEECGISIDLYIIENVFDNAMLRFLQKNMSLLCSFAISSIRFVNNKDLPKELIELEGRKLNYSGSKKIFGKVFGIILLKRWIIWCDYWNSACHSETSNFVAIPTGRKHFSGEIYDRNKMTFFKKARFETTEFNIPVWAEGYLERFYGDYMKIPPEEKREKHLFLELKY